MDYDDWDAMRRATNALSWPDRTITARAAASSSAAPKPASLSAFIATLIPVAIVSGIMLILFLVLRRTQRRQYSPRSYLSTLRPEERSPSLPTGLFNWWSEFSKISDSYVLNHQSIDGYLLLRFLKISTVICGVGCCITFPILFPVYATGGGPAQQLDVLGMGNVLKGSGRYYASVFVAWIYFAFIWYMILRETIYYINLRQAYLLSPLYASRISSRTVLYASVPEKYLDEAKLRPIFGSKVKNLWIATDTKELQKLVDERDKVAFKLEGAETKLIKTANKNRLKAIKKGTATEEEANAGPVTDTDGESGSVASRWVPAKDRPTHKLTFLIGKKVDTINWCRSELERIIPLVDAEQLKHKNNEVKNVGSVFVEFYTVKGAQEAYQTVTHHEALHMAPRWIGVNPDEVIWSNLRIKWWERVVRNAGALAFVCLLIIFWAIPVAFVGILSNLNKLIETYSWLGWLRKIPPSLFGLISGLLPSVLLAVLMALLPIILRLMAKLSGMPSLAHVELRTQNFYFAFQVIQVFLVATLASSATAVGAAIAANPGSAPSILAAQLPTASNLYISYFIVVGLSTAAGGLLQIVGLILYKVLGKLLDGTPRKMYKRFSTLGGLGWGTVMPVYSLFVVISITYSIIAPLMLIFSTVSLYLLYICNRYNLLFVYNSNIDTKGLIYPRALRQLTVGLYLAEVCMIGLMGVNVAPGPLILMIVFLVASILFHIAMLNALNPLLNTLPLSLATEEEALLSIEDGTKNGDAAITTTATTDSADNVKTSADTVEPAPHSKPNFFSKWLRPDVYTDYQTLRRLVPRDFAEITYPADIETHAYFNPAISSPTPLLWIPRDSMGISTQEIAHTSKVIPITDELAGFDEKGNLNFVEDERPPIYEEKVYY